MSEKPIIFSTPMVQAILDGRKTQTRRVIKPQPSSGITEYPYHRPDGQYIWTICGGVGISLPFRPPYKPGDILWVREAWCYGKDTHAIMFDPEPLPGDILYRADFSYKPDKEIIRWRPSIHMPREVARIFLRVTNVRVERLQEITEEDAVKKGVKAYGPNNCNGTSARIAFAELWDSLNEKRGYSWNTNPWVWVIEFERVV